MRKTILTGLTLVAAQTAAAQGALGPQGTYYLFDGDSDRGFIVQGLNSTLFTTVGQDYGVAIHGNLVRTWNTESPAGSPFNHDYDLAGNFVGNSSPAPFGFNSILDGGTDGTTNYGITCDNPGASQVYGAGADWSSPTFLFTAPGGDCGLGLTYHAGRGTLFVATGGTTIWEVSLAGATLNSFNATDASGTVGALAVDVDGSLWFFDNGGTDQLYNYLPDGTFVGAATVGGQTPFGNIWGGEIAGGISQVPEPATVASVATGLVLLAAGAWRRRRATA
jgi:hypothetical protein